MISIAINVNSDLQLIYNSSFLIIKPRSSSISLSSSTKQSSKFYRIKNNKDNNRLIRIENWIWNRSDIWIVYRSNTSFSNSKQLEIETWFDIEVYKFDWIWFLNWEKQFFVDQMMIFLIIIIKFENSTWESRNLSWNEFYNSISIKNKFNIDI